MAGLIVLAVVASLFLIFGDSVQILRIGLVAALWAAVVGAIAMTKYRRESAADKAKIRDLQTVYELQLEREVTARREYEAGVEARVRSEVSLEAGEISALRAELAALRGSLEVLFEGRLPEDRVALESDAARRGELGPGRSARPGGSPGTASFAPNPAYADPRSGPTFASPDDEPVTAEVYVVPEDGEGEAPTSEPDDTGPVPVGASGAATWRGPDAPAATRADAPEVPGPTSGFGVPSQAQWVVGADETAVPDEPAPEEPAEGESALQEESASTSRRARRRAAEADDEDGAHATGLTVAEILANMKAEEGDGDGPRQGRRRRE
ncbi:DUF6779 domain-containing protein [Rhodococcus gannanensis]|uniref:DUF6779 domain-containing protein n=1 Tax=Rhodococcus gannanensis TaxID=1960308 RepID=A0ABW4PB97_9NOCA